MGLHGLLLVERQRDPRAGEQHRRPDQPEGHIQALRPLCQQAHAQRTYRVAEIAPETVHAEKRAALCGWADIRHSGGRFVGSAGRPDLRGEEERMGGLLHDSLFNKLLTLPDHVEIFPGAQAGSVCGAGISGKPSSTIAYEKRFNTALVADKAEFVAAILADLPPQPENMAEILRYNVRGE